MATISSAQAGVWSATSTWTGGVLPTTGDTVNVNHAITYDLNDTTTKYGRINVNTGGSITHDNTKQTAIVSSYYIYVNGGKYQAGSGSQTLFYTSSKTSGVEGTGLAGIYAEGGTNNTQVILTGSTPNPETTLSTAVALGDSVLQVADASQFAAGEFIAVYRDITNDSTWGWNGTNQSDEGFTIHHISGNNIYIKQRVAIEDVITNAMAVGDTTVHVANIMKFQPNFKLWVDNELFTVQSVDETNGILTFTTAATMAHMNGASIIETGAQKTHAIGDKVYKIATILTADSANTATQITVANDSMLNVNDRVAVEGLNRSSGYPSNTAFESFITAKTPVTGWIGQWWVRNSTNYNIMDYTLLPSATILHSTVNLTNINPAGAADYYNGRITGYIIPLYNEAYTLYTTSDDGVRVYFQDSLLIDSWVDQGGTPEHSATTPVLTAGQPYKVTIEHYERSGGELVTLSWSSTSQTKQIVPATQMTQVGTQLTLQTAIPCNVSAGFIVTKTNRDCVVASTDTTDTNRCFIFYNYGSSGVTGRKCVFRYVELSHVANSYSSNYSGLAIRSDFNRSDCEREVRGCVVRDGWGVDRSGIWAYSSHYLHYRNNVVVKCQNGINLYDVNGTSTYNNLTMGNGSSTYRYESIYYYNQFQYNIGTNSQYPVLHYSDYNSVYPKWHNLFRHCERGIYGAETAAGLSYGAWMKNRYEDIYYLHNYVEGQRIIVQDIDFRNPTTTTTSSWMSGYASYDERGMTGGLLIFVNKNMIRGNFEMHGAGGWIVKDTTTQMGNGWSYGFNLNNSGYDLQIAQQIYVKYGVPVKVVVYMRKSSTYNGSRQPYILARGTYLGDQWSYMPTSVNNQWVKVELNFTPQRSELIGIAVGGRGSVSGTSLWIDPRVTVTTFDLDLIQGPYSTDLMFGLDEVSQGNPPGIVLGGGVTL